MKLSHVALSLSLASFSLAACSSDKGKSKASQTTPQAAVQQSQDQAPVVPTPDVEGMGENELPEGLVKTSSFFHYAQDGLCQEVKSQKALPIEGGVVEGPCPASQNLGGISQKLIHTCPVFVRDGLEFTFKIYESSSSEAIGEWPSISPVDENGQTIVVEEEVVSDDALDYGSFCKQIEESYDQPMTDFEKEMN